MTDYVVIYEQAEDGGWGAYLPDVPGCISLGETREEVARNIREAITLYVEELGHQGEQIPEARSVADLVPIDRAAAA